MPSLAFSCLDRRVYFCLHGAKVEGSRGLHRQVIDGGLPELRYDLLDENKPPSFPAKEIVEPSRGTLSKVQDGCPLEGVLTDVVDFGRRDLGAGPTQGWS